MTVMTTEDVRGSHRVTSRLSGPNRCNFKVVVLFLVILVAVPTVVVYAIAAQRRRPR